MDRYSALRAITPALRYIAGIVAGVGLGGSVLYLLQGPKTEWSMFIVVAGVMISLAAGIMVYALGDFFRCVMDIAEHTRWAEVSARANGLTAKSKDDIDQEVKAIAKTKANGNGDSKTAAKVKANGNGNGHSDDDAAIKGTRKLKVVQKA